MLAVARALQHVAFYLYLHLHEWMVPSCSTLLQAFGATCFGCGGDKAKAASRSRLGAAGEGGRALCAVR
jgi:hypothetical protein